MLMIQGREEGIRESRRGLSSTFLIERGFYDVPPSSGVAKGHHSPSKCFQVKPTTSRFNVRFDGQEIHDVDNTAASLVSKLIYDVIEYLYYRKIVEILADRITIKEL